MKTPMVKTRFKGFSDPALNTTTKTIIERMTNNTRFPNPTPGINDVHNAWADFASALPLAQSGDRAEIAGKNAKKDTLTGKLFTLATYVNLTAAGDAAALLTTGIPMAKDASTPKTVEKPVITVANGKNPGDMIVSVDNATGATSYLYEYTYDPVTDASIWESDGDNTRSYTFSGLDSGRKVWFRVTAIGGNSQKLLSEIVAGMVL